MGNICSPRFLRTVHSHVKCLLHLLPEKWMFFDNSKDGKSKLTPRHHYLLLRHRIIICLCKQLHHKTHRKKRVLIRAPLNTEIIELLFRKGEVVSFESNLFHRCNPWPLTHTSSLSTISVSRSRYRKTVAPNSRYTKTTMESRMNLAFSSYIFNLAKQPTWKRKCYFPILFACYPITLGAPFCMMTPVVPGLINNWAIIVGTDTKLSNCSISLKKNKSF